MEVADLEPIVRAIVQRMRDEEREAGAAKRRKENNEIYRQIIEQRDPVPLSEMAGVFVLVLLVVTGGAFLYVFILRLAKHYM